MMEHLGIEFTLLEEGLIEATMPVGPKVHQPVGLLHGGASAALAESVGSLGSSMLVDLNKTGVVGVEINVNHLRGKREGMVKARGELIHHGRKTHVWDIKIRDEKEKLIAVSRLTVMIVER